MHPNGDSCGNSISSSGAQLTDSNIYANHINNSPQLQQGWIDHLMLEFGAGSKGGVAYYQLDNEPGGWGNTHRDVLPQGANYDTIFNLGSEYAAMIKATDASAQIMGPSDFTLGGWLGSSTDMQEHGGLYAGQWYLQQMQAYQTRYGTRLIDYFDEHVYGGSATDANYELQSTRSLWDPAYNSGTWVEQWYFGNMQLIPRFKNWINQYYPGTKLAFTEYSWGWHNTLTGALAEADILGIFGREQVDFANMWDPPKATDPTAYTFRLYRNYDGAGNMFGDVSVSAQSGDQTQLAVYGAQRNADGALTLVVINKTANAITGVLNLANFNAAGSAQLYGYSNANLQAIVAEPNATISNSSMRAAFAAQSATMIVVPQSKMPLMRTAWKASATSSAGGNYNAWNQLPASAIDGNIGSRWSSGQLQKGGEAFGVDMGALQTFSGISLNAGNASNDYPRQVKVYVSVDGMNWGNPIASATGTGPLVNVTFPSQKARYVLALQTGSAALWWSIAEFNVTP